jgi:hypothetical protein
MAEEAAAEAARIRATEEAAAAEQEEERIKAEGRIKAAEEAAAQAHADAETSRIKATAEAAAAEEARIKAETRIKAAEEAAAQAKADAEATRIKAAEEAAAAAAAEEARVKAQEEAKTKAVAIRVVRAQLNRSFDKLGKMDTFATIQWCSSEGAKREIGRTRVVNGLTPNWDYACPKVGYRGVDACDTVHFQVFDKNFMGIRAPTLCGEAIIPVAKLLDRKTQFDLYKKEKVSGTIHVTADLVDP